MRTTLSIPDELLREAKTHAAEQGCSLAQVVTDALRSALARKAQKPHRALALPTFDGNGLRPGLSLDDTSELLDAMEGQP